MCPMIFPLTADLLWNKKMILPVLVLSSCWVWLKRPVCARHFLSSCGHVDTSVDSNAFVYRLVCRWELCDFAPEATNLFKGNWKVCFYWIQSGSISCLFFPPSNLLETLYALHCFPQLAQHLCKQSAPHRLATRAFPTAVLCPPPPFAMEILTIFQVSATSTPSIMSLLTVSDTRMSPHPESYSLLFSTGHIIQHFTVYFLPVTSCVIALP